MKTFNQLQLEVDIPTACLKKLTTNGKLIINFTKKYCLLKVMRHIEINNK